MVNGYRTRPHVSPEVAVQRQQPQKRPQNPYESQTAQRCNHSKLGTHSNCPENSSFLNDHTRRASAGDSRRPGSEIGGGEGTAEESPPAGRVTDETNFRLADDSPTEESYLSSECNGDLSSAGIPERNPCTWTRYSRVPRLKPRASVQIP